MTGGTDLPFASGHVAFHKAGLQPRPCREPVEEDT
jgi:hypothetical protein